MGLSTLLIRVCSLLFLLLFVNSGSFSTGGEAHAAASSHQQSYSDDSNSSAGHIQQRYSPLLHLAVGSSLQLQRWLSHFSHPSLHAQQHPNQLLHTTVSSSSSPCTSEAPSLKTSLEAHSTMKKGKVASAGGSVIPATSGGE